MRRLRDVGDGGGQSGRLAAAIVAAVMWWCGWCAQTPRRGGWRWAKLTPCCRYCCGCDVVVRVVCADSETWGLAAGKADALLPLLLRL